MKKIINNQGYTLLEIILTVALFTTAVMMATGIFKSVIDQQRSAIAAQNIQESMRYAMEMMSKEIRSATISNNECEYLVGGTAVQKVFNKYSDGTGDDILYFKNKNKECVAYSLADDGGILRLRIVRFDGVNTVDEYITPDELNITNLRFNIVDNEITDIFPDEQPRVTMSMDVENIDPASKYKYKIKLQTTISARYYE